MVLVSGTRLGPYEVYDSIGAGGMGEVYRARDTRLDREVAIKILPESFATDADRLRRFEQEARTLAKLNHPNIVAIFDVGQFNGAAYVVSELLEGETLRNKLRGGALSSRRAIECAAQIAEGLAAAHDKGVTHRDLKPENLFITKDSRVKILDFGLAKLKQPNIPADAEGQTSASVAQTTPGFIVGTAGYMSPEQVRGREVDTRSDIFSLGAILYEMLCGQRAFKGETSVETMNSILKDDPPELDTAKLQVSPGLERVVRRCLDKEPEHRFQSARDVSFAIEALSGSSAAMRIGMHRRWWLWPAISATTMLVAMIALVLALSRNSSEPVTAMHFAIPMRDEVSHLALSPDGNTLAFVSPDENSGTPMLFLQEVGSDAATALPDTSGATYPFWSPDNQYIAFFASARLSKIRALGGPAQPLATVTQSPRGGAWSRKGVIVYAPDAGGCLWRVNADGTGAAPLTEKLFAGDFTHRWPTFLPDGEHLLFYSGDFGKENQNNGLYVTTLAGKDKRLVVPAATNASFAQPKYLFYADASGRLFVREFDPDKQVMLGEPKIALNHIGFQPSVLWAAFTASEHGTVVANSSSAAWRSVLTWYDRTGKELGTVGQPGILYNAALSPDGRRIAVDVADTQAAAVNVWIYDTVAATSTRFTFGRDNEDVESVWSPDSKRIAYRSFQAGLVVKAANGLEKERVVVRLPSNGDDVLPNAWAPDARSLVYTVQSARGGSQLFLVNVADGRMVQLVPGKAHHSHGQISPDGKWLAYASDESGTWEVYVTTFPAAQGKWQVSQGGGTEPRWLGNGKEIFYIAANGMLTAVPVTTDGGFSSGSPRDLFTVRGRARISSTDLYSYDVSQDGRRFIVNKYQKPASVPPLEIVLNATK